MAILQESQVGMVVSDVQMKPVDGFALLKKIKAFNPELPVLLMTAYGDVEKAVAAMQTGACDYLLKPFDPDNLLAHIKRHALSEPEQDDNVVAKDPRTRALLSLAKRVAQSPATVMLTGESGCGKEVIARFIHHHALSLKNPLHVATKTSQLMLTVNPDQSVTVDFGKPHWDPAHIPLQARTQADQYFLPFPDQGSHPCYALSVGNPHAVTIVDDLSSINIQEMGEIISIHPHFPEQTNAGFMKIIDPSHIQLRVYERGCGETSACGSAAVAAAAVGRRFFHMSPKIMVDLPGGTLIVEWPSLDGSIQLTGPATFVYEGTLLTCE